MNKMWCHYGKNITNTIIKQLKYWLGRGFTVYHTLKIIIKWNTKCRIHLHLWQRSLTSDTHNPAIWCNKNQTCDIPQTKYSSAKHIRSHTLMTEVWHLHIYSLLLASLHTGKKLPDVLFTHHLLVLCKFLQVLLQLDLHIIILCKDFQLSYKRSSDIYNGTKPLFQFLTSHRIQTGTQVLSCNKSKLKLEQLFWYAYTLVWKL